MTKLDFIALLRHRLSHLPDDELEARLNFFTEMIDDHMEDGLSEEEAVAATGSVDEIVNQICAEYPTSAEPSKKRQLKVWEIVLLALGSPIWLSLLIAAFSVVLSLYVSIWAVIISLYATFAALAGSAVGCSIIAVVIAFNSNIYQGIAILGCAFVCAGLSIFLFYGCKALTNVTVLLTKKLFSRHKKGDTHNE